ncbi:hypothetical protein ACHWQZ_G001204 [Mnemiopsis leidyi]
MDGDKSRSRSRSPHRSDSPNSPSSKWTCKNCSSENESNRDKCGKCRLAKGVDKKEVFTEDWECDKCRANNFSRRIDCFKCHARKPPLDPKHPHDWECPACKGNNFSRRVTCFKCGEPKPRFISSSGIGTEEPRDGSWYCDCGSLNYSRRTDCYKCRLPKPRGYDSRGSYGNQPRGGMSRMRSPTPERGYRQRSPIRFNPSLPERAPDVDPVTGEAEWLCPVCGVSNFYKRFDCYRCFEKKPLDSGVIVRDGRPMYPESRDPPYNADSAPRTTYSNISASSYSNVSAPPPGPLSIPKKRFPTDWICPDCHGLNYSKRTDCFKCHLAKPEDGAGYDSRVQLEKTTSDGLTVTGVRIPNLLEREIAEFLLGSHGYVSEGGVRRGEG